MKGSKYCDPSLISPMIFLSFFHCFEVFDIINRNGKSKIKEFCENKWTMSSYASGII